MASLTAIRDGLKNVILNGTASQIYCYDTVTDLAQLPAAIVMPAPVDTADFVGAAATMGRGTDTWYFNVYVICARADSQAGQIELDGFVCGSGPDSVRRAIEDRDDLGLSDNTEATVMSLKGYGGRFESASVHVIGAFFTVRVYTDGRA